MPSPSTESEITAAAELNLNRAFESDVLPTTLPSMNIMKESSHALVPNVAGRLSRNSQVSFDA